MFYIICWCYPFLENLFPLRKRKSSMLRTLELNRWLERGNTYYFCPATATEFKSVENSQIHFPLQTWAKGRQHTIKFSFHNPVVGFFLPLHVYEIIVQNCWGIFIPIFFRLYSEARNYKAGEKPRRVHAHLYTPSIKHLNVITAWAELFCW